MNLLPTDLSMYPSDTYFPLFNPCVMFDTNGMYPALRSVVIEQMERAAYTQSSVFAGVDSYVANSLRTSSIAQVSQEIYKAVKNRLDYVVDWAISQQADRRQYLLSEGIQFLKYEGKDNGRFVQHTDNAYIDSAGEFFYTSPKRILSTITFLNDDFVGGELVFPTVMEDKKQQLIIKPKAGLTVIFPSDLRFPHEVRPVTEGTRYSIVGWYGL